MNNLTANQPEKLILESLPIQLANAATQRPGNSSRCEQLLQDIKVLSQGGGSISYTKYSRYFTNQSDPTQKFNGVITKSISQRYAELLADKNDLWNTRKTGANSYEGHQTFLQNQQNALAAALEEFTRTCNENRFTNEQRKILGQGRIAIKTPIPLAPDPRLRELTKPGNFNLVEAIKVITDILIKAGIITAAVLAAIVVGVIKVLFGIDVGQNLVQKELDNSLAQLGKNRPTGVSTSLLQEYKLDKSIDRSTASAEELLENAYKVASRVGETKGGESPEFKELIKQLDEQKNKLAELNQVDDQVKQNQREIG
jgi:hypothetical protein